MGSVPVEGFTYGTVDRYPGITGGGDTRYEGTVPGSMWLPYEPRRFDPWATLPPEATGLLAATEVASLNANLGRSGADRKPYAGLPTSLLVRAFDLGGRPLTGMEIDFFASVGGKVDMSAPLYTVATSEQGVAILPRQESGFVGTDPAGLLLARATQNGVTEYTWLKAWQIADAYARGATAAALVDLRFNLPSSPLEAGTNLAVNRIVSDSAGSAATKLAGLVDESVSTEVALPEEKGSWVEIDLGRDRTIGEIVILAKPGEFWRQFDLIGYATGQSPTNVQPFAQELDWDYTARNRSLTLDPVRAVAYRGGARFRFVRIVNKSGGAGKLAGVRVTPAIVGG
jgi:hypothetical protein